MRGRWLVRIFPRTILDAHPVVGGMKVVALVGSAAAFAVFCPGVALVLGAVGLVMGGWSSLAFSDHPDLPGCIGPWIISSIKREQMRTGGPYYWRWGVIAVVLGLVVVPFGGVLEDCGDESDADATAHHVTVGG
jgi:hypothetical protein